MSSHYANSHFARLVDVSAHPAVREHPAHDQMLHNWGATQRKVRGPVYVQDEMNKLKVKARNRLNPNWVRMQEENIGRK